MVGCRYSKYNELGNLIMTMEKDDRNIYRNPRIKSNRRDEFIPKEELAVRPIFEQAIVADESGQWSIRYEESIRLNARDRYHPDMIIYQDGFPFAVVEVRPTSRDLNRFISRIRYVASSIYAPWCFICTPQKLIGFKTEDASFGIKSVDLTVENIRLFLSEKQPIKQDVTWNEFRNKCLESLEQVGIEESKREKIKNFFSNDKILISNEPESFSFDSETDEDTLFLSLLGSYTKERLCRFTTVNSIFRTCNEKEQSMCCIICMNDRSEISYTVQKLDTPENSEEINKCFILSCCDEDRANDFTMLRLYADDAKGVCMEYSIDYDLLEKNGFVLAPISYAQNEQQKHPELDFIRNILDNKIHGKRLKLKKLSIWRHFFKPYEYSDEQEVRLLFFRNSNFPKLKWIYESHFGIITPIITFSVEKNNNQFPLKLEKITFGPIAKSADVNVDQLALLIKSNGIEVSGNSDSLVSNSPIEHYRGY